MGTNYYLKLDVCPHCGRERERIHIGKSSAGWCFALHVDPERGLHDLEDWKALWSSYQAFIVDEQSNPITEGAMLDIITDRSWLVKPGFDYEGNRAIPGPNGCIRRRLGAYCVKHGAGTWDCILGEFS
jgi:hypothetical protein